MAFAVMVSLLVSLTLTPMLSARIARTDGAGTGTATSGSTGWIDAVYRRIAASGRSITAASSSRSALLDVRVDVSAAPHGRPIVPAQRGPWGSSSWSSTRRRARRSQGMEKTVLELTPQLLAGPGHRARDADHLRARQPLAHLHPAEAARRAVGDAGADRDDGAQGRWRRYPAYQPTVVMQDADRRRRERRRSRSRSI